MSVAVPTESAERDSTERMKVGSRRTMLCALVLNALLWMVCALLAPKESVRPWARVGLWGLFVWSLVVTAYAVYTYLTARSFTREVSSTMTDALTGLPNRKGLVAELDSYDAEIEEFGRRVRLIDVDLVNLNKVNYEFGQLIGDVVLQDIADLLRRTVPEGDLVGRLGGDEFLVVMPRATAAEAESLAERLGGAVADYKLSLGEGREVRGLKANVSVAAYLPHQASLHETVTSAKEQTAHGRLPEAAGDEQAYYHVPRVTLGAFAAHRWQELSKDQRDGFKLWQRDSNEPLTEQMVSDIVRMLDEKAETHWVDFVTAPPSPGGRGSPTQQLARAVAEQLGVPYREVMRADASGPETRSIEPDVDAVIDRGDAALLVCDVISSGILERRCVKKLSSAGVHVQVAAWAAY